MSSDDTFSLFGTIPACSWTDRRTTVLRCVEHHAVKTTRTVQLYYSSVSTCVAFSAAHFLHVMTISPSSIHIHYR